MASALTMALFIGFLGVFAVAAAVVVTFAGRLRKRTDDAKRESRASKARGLVRAHEIGADVHDALSYQKRSNEEANRRVRRAEDKAREVEASSEEHERALAEATEANARLAARHVRGTALIAKHAENIHSSADAARAAAFERAQRNVRLLRDLERSIDKVQKGAVSPDDVRREVERLEGEFARQRDEADEASRRFYRTVTDLVEESDRATSETARDISSLFATKEDVEEQSAILLRDVEEASGRLEAQYASLLERAEEVSSSCSSYGGEVDMAAVDRVNAKYDDILAKVSDYGARVKDNESRWGELNGVVSELEASSAGLGEEVGAALADLDAYIRSNCVEASEVKRLASSLSDTRALGERLLADVEAASAGCATAQTTCDQARDRCESVEGSSAVSLSEGGAIDLGGAGTLSMAEGRLEYCSASGACTRLT